MSNKFDAAMSGFNNNIPHQGKVYHVQTEDSGKGHPHIITHVFVEGHIVGTRKTPYEEHVGKPNLREIVRDMMKEQHRAMALAIRDGLFDDEKTHAREVQEPDPKVKEKEKSRLRGISGVYRSIQRREGAPPPAPRSSRRSVPPLRTGSRRGGREVAAEKPDAGAGSDRSFGEELLTDKTLEEVIASYLSEDLGKG